MNKIKVLIILFSINLMFFSLMFFSCTTSNSSKISSGKTAPEINAESWINTDKPVKLSDLKGKYVVLEFWATWCGPCIQSIPHLNKLYKENKDKNVVFISLTNENRKKSKIDEFVKKMKMEYIIGTGSDSGKKYGVRGIPSAFLIGPESKILWSGHPMSGLDQVLKKYVSGE